MPGRTSPPLRKGQRNQRRVAGPILGICEAAQWFVADVHCNGGVVELVTCDGIRLNLMEQHKTIFKRTLTELTRQGILHRLRQRVVGQGGGSHGKTSLAYPMSFIYPPPSGSSREGIHPSQELLLTSSDRS